MRRAITQHLRVAEVDRHEKYLGLPTIVGKSKKVVFASIKERIWKKLQGWKERFLSRAGKEVLIKAVIQAIPTYLMSIFRIPDGIINDINSMIAKFWWGSENGRLKMHWHSWTHMCLPKCKGGMGFRDIRVFNSALLAKQIWRIHNGDTPLLAAIPKARYFKHSDVLTAHRGYDPSYTWRSLWGSKSLLLEGLVWRVGNGLSINPWTDKWIIVNGIARGLSSEATYDTLFRVSDLIDFNQGCWKINAIQRVADADVRNAILSIPLSLNWPIDSVFWIHTKDGRYTVKSGYWLGRVHGQDLTDIVPTDCFEKFWKKVWNLKCHPKLHHFLWRACNGSLAVNEERHRRHITTSPICARCNVGIESTCHALVDCPTTSDVWATHPAGLLIQNAPRSSFRAFFSWLMENVSGDLVILTATACWAILFVRNQATLAGSSLNVVDTVKQFTMMVHDHASYATKVYHPLVFPQELPSQWLPPEENWVKINVDAHLAQEANRGLGAVIRDSNGTLLAVGIKRINALWPPEISELAAAVYGIELALFLGYTNVHLEGDNQQVLQNIKNQASGWSPFYLMLDRVQHLIKSLSGFKCNFIRRCGNTAAHMVARWNSNSFGETIFMYPFPQSLVTMVSLDLC